uniref:Olfactory receptor n=1 Tax=Erpetoichthys calabaricus TaxID=27687 RepID=A0A8C4STA8_ERPCA
MSALQKIPNLGIKPEVQIRRILGMNHTSLAVSEFVLKCEMDAQQKSYTTPVLTMVYLVTLFGNFLVILVIKMNHHLQTPMYLYIAALATLDLLNSTSIAPTIIAALLDVSPVQSGLCLFQMILVLYLEAVESLLLALMACDRYVAIVHPLRYSSLVTNKTVWVALMLLNIIPAIFMLPFIVFVTDTNLIPKMLAVLLDSPEIASGPCILQMFLVLHLEAVESLLFALMACDRYVAVVHPLRYPSLITNKIVWVGVFISNVVGTLALVPYLVFVHELPFCRTRVLPYCFCDYATMVNIACTEEIAYAALSISSIDGKKKVFSTLGTHLLVVGLFYLPLLISYMLPGIGIKLSTEAYNTMVIVSNVVPPMMNPLIYSFRNKEIKGSIQRLFKWKVTPETGRR